MSRFIFILFLTAFFQSLSLHAQNTPDASEQVSSNEVIRKLETDSDKVSFLLFINDNLPGAFDNASKHQVDLLNVLESYLEQRKTFSSQIAGLQKSFPRASGLLRFQMEAAQGSGELSSLRIPPERFKFWRESLSLKVIHEMEDSETEIRKFIYTKVQTLSEKLAQRAYHPGLLTALLMMTPKIAQQKFQSEKGGSVFQASSKDQLIYLEQELPESLTEAGFDPSKVGLPPQLLKVLGEEESEKKSILRSVLRNTFEEEGELSIWSQLAILAQDGEGQFPDSKTNLLALIETFDEASLDYFRDPHIYNERKENFFPEEEAQDNEAKKKSLAEKLFDRSVRLGTRIFETQLEKVHSSLLGQVVLEEVPPEISIFRGCTGGDCATSLSANFPISPLERVFLIRGPQGRIKGYVSMTKLQSEGIDSLYVHTIAGPYVSPSDTSIILLGLAENLHHFQADQVLLPSPDRMSGLINFAPISSAISVLASSKLVPLMYLDTSVRDKIQGSSYDRSKSNTQARALQGLDKKPKLKIKVSSSNLPEFHPKPITYEEALFLALDLESMGSPASSRRVRALSPKEIPDNKFDQLAGSLDNSNLLSVSDYLEDIKSHLNALDIDLNSEEFEDLLERNTHLFYEGFIVASDFQSSESFEKLSKKRQDQIIMAFSSELDQPVDSLSQNSRQLLSTHSSLLSQHPIFQKFLRSLLADAESSNFLLLFNLLQSLQKPVDGLQKVADSFISQLSSQAESEKNIESIFWKIVSYSGVESQDSIDFIRESLDGLRAIQVLAQTKLDREEDREFLIGLISGQDTFLGVQAPEELSSILFQDWIESGEQSFSEYLQEKFSSDSFYPNPEHELFVNQALALVSRDSSAILKSTAHSITASQPETVLIALEILNTFFDQFLKERDIYGQKSNSTDHLVDFFEEIGRQYLIALDKLALNGLQTFSSLEEETLSTTLRLLQFTSYQSGLSQNPKLERALLNLFQKVQQPYARLQITRAAHVLLPQNDFFSDKLLDELTKMAKNGKFGDLLPRDKEYYLEYFEMIENHPGTSKGKTLDRLNDIIVHSKERFQEQAFQTLLQTLRKPALRETVDGLQSLERAIQLVFDSLTSDHKKIAGNAKASLLEKWFTKLLQHIGSLKANLQSLQWNSVDSIEAVRSLFKFSFHQMLDDQKMPISEMRSGELLFNIYSIDRQFVRELFRNQATLEGKLAVLTTFSPFSYFHSTLEKEVLKLLKSEYLLGSLQVEKDYPYAFYLDADEVEKKRAAILFGLRPVPEEKLKPTREKEVSKSLPSSAAFQKRIRVLLSSLFQERGFERLDDLLLREIEEELPNEQEVKPAEPFRANEISLIHFSPDSSSGISIFDSNEHKDPKEASSELLANNLLDWIDSFSKENLIAEKKVFSILAKIKPKDPKVLERISKRIQTQDSQTQEPANKPRSHSFLITRLAFESMQRLDFEDPQNQKSIKRIEHSVQNSQAHWPLSLSLLQKTRRVTPETQRLLVNAWLNDRNNELLLNTLHSLELDDPIALELLSDNLGNISRDLATFIVMNSSNLSPAFIETYLEFCQKDFARGEAYPAQAMLLARQHHLYSSERFRDLLIQAFHNSRALEEDDHVKFLQIVASSQTPEPDLHDFLVDIPFQWFSQVYPRSKELLKLQIRSPKSFEYVLQNIWTDPSQLIEARGIVKILLRNPKELIPVFIQSTASNPFIDQEMFRYILFVLIKKKRWDVVLEMAQYILNSSDLSHFFRRNWSGEKAVYEDEERAEFVERLRTESLRASQSMDSSTAQSFFEALAARPEIAPEVLAFAFDQHQKSPFLAKLVNASLLKQPEETSRVAWKQGWTNDGLDPQYEASIVSFLQDPQGRKALPNYNISMEGEEKDRPREPYKPKGQAHYFESWFPPPLFVFEKIESKLKAGEGLSSLEKRLLLRLPYQEASEFELSLSILKLIEKRRRDISSLRIFANPSDWNTWSEMSEQALRGFIRRITKITRELVQSSLSLVDLQLPNDVRAHLEQLITRYFQENSDSESVRLLFQNSQTEGLRLRQSIFRSYEDLRDLEGLQLLLDIYEANGIDVSRELSLYRKDQVDLATHQRLEEIYLDPGTPFAMANIIGSLLSFERIQKKPEVFLQAFEVLKKSPSITMPWWTLHLISSYPEAHFSSDQMKLLGGLLESPDSFVRNRARSLITSQDFIPKSIPSPLLINPKNGWPFFENWSVRIKKSFIRKTCIQGLRLLTGH